MPPAGRSGRALPSTRRRGRPDHPRRRTCRPAPASTRPSVTVRPVIDLQVPAELAEATRLLHPYTGSPFSTTRSRGKHVDTDHTEHYVPDPDQPGQTRLDNLGPLGRGGHRCKTFARGVTVAQPTLGVLLWRTRHGFCFQVDQHGTHPFGKTTATEFHALIAELALEDTDQPDDEDLAG
jgi:hypothetical protein